MLALTVMLIALAAALPSVYHESQREKEEELIFRGNEYAHAIYLFRLRFQRYPTSVDELIRTNNIRFLRHAYKDPMSPNGKWRFIHVAGNGALIDSLTMGPQQSPVGAFGQSQSGLSQTSSTFGGSQQGQSDQGAQGDQSTQNEKRKARSGCDAGKSESAFFSDNQVMGAPIAGVASCSDKGSIRVYNKKTKYEEWEFLGVAFQPLGFPGVPQPQPTPTPQTQQAPGMQPPQPGQVPTPTGVQSPPDTPLTDQPPPEQPQEPPQASDNPP
jgi:type II secretory pathway pseudopilin PulG